MSTVCQVSAFASLNLNPELLENLHSLGYERMTPIQSNCLPHILSGRDVIAQGKTGSGKTAAFGLGILADLEPKRFNVQALVLCPTRELADQVAEEIRRLARQMQNIKVLTLCGGSPLRAQASSLGKGVHIVVGTPGRVEDHLKRETLQLQQLKFLVLDEADRMLAMGFEESLNMILNYVPKQRQTLLLSATYPEAIQNIAQRVLTNPETIVVESNHDNKSIAQHFFKVTDDHQRLAALRLVLLKYRPNSALVFCSTRQNVRDVTAKLKHQGFHVLAMHGELEQRERDLALIQFNNGSVTIMVATDVAARGLDIDSLDIVVNFHLGRTPEDHVHRIGRTGRAGESGIALSFYDQHDSEKLQMLQQQLGQNISNAVLPSLDSLNQQVPTASMVSLQIDAGKKNKIRPGDILGALTGSNGLEANHVGKIKIVSNRSYVAIRRASVNKALNILGSGKLKGRSYRVRKL